MNSTRCLKWGSKTQNSHFPYNIALFEDSLLVYLYKTVRENLYGIHWPIYLWEMIGGCRPLLRRNLVITSLHNADF